MRDCTSSSPKTEIVGITRELVGGRGSHVRNQSLWGVKEARLSREEWNVGAFAIIAPTCPQEELWSKTDLPELF